MRSVLVALLIATAVLAQHDPSHDRATVEKYLEAAMRKDVTAQLALIADAATITLALPESDCKSFNKTAWGEYLRSGQAGAEIIDIRIATFLSHPPAHFAAALDEIVVTPQGGNVMQPFIKGTVAEGKLSSLDILIGNPKAGHQLTLFENVLNALKNGTATEMARYFTPNATFEYCDPILAPTCFKATVADYITQSATWFASRQNYGYSILRHGATCGLNVGLTADWWNGNDGSGNNAGTMYGFNMFVTQGGGNDHPASPPLVTQWKQFMFQQLHKAN